MYINNRNGYSEFYEYVGMAYGKDELFTQPNLFLKCDPEQMAIIKHEAIKFREERLKFDLIGKHELQILEQAVILMMPHAGLYYRNEPREIFVYDFGIKGIHYFKRVD